MMMGFFRNLLFEYFFCKIFFYYLLEVFLFGYEEVWFLVELKIIYYLVW